jgi:hypothetical protein
MDQQERCEEQMRKHRRNLVLLPILLYVASFLLPDDPTHRRWEPAGAGAFLGAVLGSVFSAISGEWRGFWSCFLPLLANPVFLCGALALALGDHKFAVGFGIAAFALASSAALFDPKRMFEFPSWWVWDASMLMLLIAGLIACVSTNGRRQPLTTPTTARTAPNQESRTGIADHVPNQPR